MALPKLPTSGLDDINHRRRHREVTNGILDFSFDDSRVRTAAEVAAGVTPVNYAYAPGNVKRYGATGNGSTDDRAAIQTAIDVMQQIGGTVYIPAGQYLIRRIAGLDSQYNGLVIPYTDVFGNESQLVIEGDGHASCLLAGDNSMTVVRWSDSHNVLRDLAIDGNAKTGVTGLSLIGSDTTDTSLAEHIDWNLIERISINACAEGIELESPSAGGCYYNTFIRVRLYSNTRHIRFRDNATAKGANRNLFIGCNMNSGNTGVWLDGVDTCCFLNCTFEAIADGTSPSATPTAVWINNTGSVGAASTQDNNFIGCMFESCTQDLDCSNNRTYIIGGNCGAVGAVVSSANPNLWIGGDHDFWARELLLGGSGSDSLLVDNRRSGFNASNPMIATTADASGSYPFQNDGSIVVQSRRQTASGILLATGSSSDSGLQLTGDGHADFLKCDVGFTQSATSNAISDNGTITTTHITMARVNPAGNRTGIILESGTQPSQLCVVVNENSSNSITFAASGTSHVAGGASVSVAALSSRAFWWDNVQSLWF